MLRKDVLCVILLVNSDFLYCMLLTIAPLFQAFSKLGMKFWHDNDDIELL